MIYAPQILDADTKKTIDRKKQYTEFQLDYGEFLHLQMPQDYGVEIILPLSIGLANAMRRA
jgi:hypothetical protein